MSKYVDELHDRIKRADHVKSWKPRFRRLTKKKMTADSKKKWSVAAFCRLYKLDNSQIAHAMAGRRGLEWETIERVEEAFKAVGV